MAGVSVETQDEYKRSPLWYAAAYAHTETMQKLLSMGAKIKYSDNNGWTPLHAAARNGHLNIVRDLLRHDSTTSNNNDLNPRNYLINQADKTGFTVLHKAVWSDNTAIADLLLRHANSDVNRASSEDRITPLHLAVNRGNSQMVDLLLKNSADVNSRTNNGLTPLMLATQREEAGIVRLLLQKGADPELITDNGWTALHMAAETNSSSCLQLLLRRPKIEINRRNNSGWTAFLLAARHSRTDSMKALCESGADTQVITEQGNSALHLAAMDDNQGGVRCILSFPNPPTLTLKNAAGQTPLHIAAARGSVSVGEHLIKAGAPINLRDGSDCSCLHLAAQNRHVGMVKLLLTSGANPIHSLSLFKFTWCGLKVNSSRPNLLMNSRLLTNHSDKCHEN